MSQARELDFRTLEVWFDELSVPEQQALTASCPSVDSLPTKLLPPSHGASIQEQLQVGKKKFKECVAAGSPFYLARIGDCEVAAMGCGFFAHTPHPLPKPQMQWSCGFERDFLAYRGELLTALDSAHLLGVQENWLPWRVNTTAILTLLGWPIPHPRAVEVHLPYQMLVDGSLFSFLEGKDVLFVGGLAERLANAWSSPEFVKYHRRFGPLDKVRSVSALRTFVRGESGGAWRSLEHVTASLGRMRFDVALISAGVPAKILAHRIWKMGKTALDVGFVFDALLGSDERRLRPALRDVSWPEGPAL